MGALIITDDMAQELFRKYCEGVTIKDMARELGVGKSTISTAFARRGLKRGAAKNGGRQATGDKLRLLPEGLQVSDGSSREGRRDENDALRLYPVSGERFERLRSGSGMRQV